MGNGNNYNGGSGLTSGFNQPQSIAVTKTTATSRTPAFAVVGDWGNNQLRMVAGPSATGSASTVQSQMPSGPGGGADYRYITVGAATASRVYFTQQNYHRVMFFTPASQLVTAVAGVTYQSGWADGAGAQSYFCNPWGTALSPAGTVLYVADTCNHRVRAITLSGLAVTTYAGRGDGGTTHYADGAALNAVIPNPLAIAAGADGTVYVSDSSQRIRAVALGGGGGVGGTVSQLAGCGINPNDQQYTRDVDGVAAMACFGQIYAFATDLTGATLIVADRGGQTIRAVTLATATVWTLAGVPMTPGGGNGFAPTFYSPSGVAVDSAGAVWVADQSNNVIRVLTGCPGLNAAAPTATPTPSPGYAPPAAGGAGGGGSGCVVSSFVGKPYQQGGWNQAFNGASPMLAGPTHGVAADAAGRVLWIEPYSNQIREVLPNGTAVTVAGYYNAGGGSQDGTGSGSQNTGTNSAAGFQFNWNQVSRVEYGPGGISVVPPYSPLPYYAVFTDIGNFNVRALTMDATGTVGTVVTLAGGGVDGSTPPNWGQRWQGYADGDGTKALFYWPAGVVNDNQGNVYVADTQNGVVRLVVPLAGPLGAVSTLAGAPPGVSGNRCPRCSSRSTTPSGSPTRTARRGRSSSPTRAATPSRCSTWRRSRW